MTTTQTPNQNVKLHTSPSRVATMKAGARTYPCQHTACTAIFNSGLMLRKHLDEFPIHATPEQIERRMKNVELNKKRKQKESRAKYAKKAKAKKARELKKKENGHATEDVLQDVEAAVSSALTKTKKKSTGQAFCFSCGHDWLPTFKFCPYCSCEALK
jgi:hypothetical protein